MSKIAKIMLVATVVACISSGTAFAVAGLTTTINVLEDARTWKHESNTGLEDTNFGTFHRTDTRVSNVTVDPTTGEIVEEVPGRPVDLQGLLRFDIDLNWLQSLGPTDILSATFKGNSWSLVNAQTDPNDHIDVVLITEADWTEGGVTYNTRDGTTPWNTPGTPGGTTVISAPFGPFPNAPLNDAGTPNDPADDFPDPDGPWFEDLWEQDAMAMVEMWRAGAPNYGLFLTRSGYVPDFEVHYASFYSRDAEANQDSHPGAKAPQLVIEYIPEPMTVAMLGIGALALMRRRMA